MTKYKENKEEELDEKNYVRVPIEKLNDKSEPVREFKTYKILKDLNTDCDGGQTEPEFAEFTESEEESFGEYISPSVEELRTLFPSKSDYKYINEG